MSEFSGGQTPFRWATRRGQRPSGERSATTGRGQWVDPAADPITSIVPFDRSGDRYVYYRSYLCTISAGQWALAGSGWITLLGMEILAPGSALRTLGVFGFVLFCPGLAVSGLVPIRESIERWVLSVALSMSLGLLVSVAFTVAREDSVTLRIGTLAVITTTAVIADAVGSPRRFRSLTPTDEKALR